MMETKTEIVSKRINVERIFNMQYLRIEMINLLSGWTVPEKWRETPRNANEINIQDTNT